MKRISFLVLILCMLFATSGAWAVRGIPGNLIHKGVSGHDVTGYGAKGDGATNDSAAFTAAIAAAAGNRVIVPAGTYRLSGNVTVPAGVEVVFQQGGLLSIDTGITFTINGSLDAGLYQIFSGAGSVSLAAGSSERVLPQWWGAIGDGSTDCTAAIQAAINAASAAGGGIVFLPLGTYKITSITLYDNLTLQGVSKNASILEGTAAAGTMIITGTGSRKRFISIRDVKIVATGYDIAVDWSDVSHGDISYCSIMGADYGIVLQNQAYVNQIIHNRVTSNLVAVLFAAGVDGNDEPNANFLTNLTIVSSLTGILFESGYSGVNNLITGGYMEGTSIGILVRNTSQKIIGAGMEGATGIATSTAATTTFGATTAVDGTAWDLSLVSVGMLAGADGKYGRVTDVNDGTDTITVADWYPSQPDDGSEVIVAAAGIVLFASGNSVLGPYMGGGYSNAYYYIVDPTEKNTVLSAYQFSTNVIGAREAGQRALKLVRTYASGNPSGNPVLLVENDGIAEVGVIGAKMSSGADYDSTYLSLNKDDDTVLVIERDASINAEATYTLGEVGSASRDSRISAPNASRNGNGWGMSAGDLVLKAGWIEKILTNGYSAAREYFGGNLILGAGSAENVREYGKVYGDIIFRIYANGEETYTDTGNTEDTEVDLSTTGGNDDQEWVARKFTATLAGFVKSITVRMGKEGTPAGTLNAYIYTDNTPTFPNAAAGGASDAISCDDLVTAGGDVTFTWTSDYPNIGLLHGESTTFWVVIKSTDYIYASGVTEVRWLTDADGATGLDECAKYDADGAPWTSLGANVGADLTVTLREYEELMTIDGLSKGFKALKLSDTNDTTALSVVWNENDTDERILNLLVHGATRTLDLNESLTVGDGNDGTITFSAASKVITIEDNAVVSQDLTSDASPTFATLDTGQGANELYDMDQNVLTISTPAFAALDISGEISMTSIASSDGAGLGNRIAASSPIMAYIPGGYYREANDKWQYKGTGAAADRYTLQSPARLMLDVDDTMYLISAQTDYVLSTAATWDTQATDYTVAANRAGLDFYIYAIQPASGTTPLIEVSANSSAPDGYTTANSRKIGGFHCLCVAVGAIGGHTLTGFVAGDILPASVWDYDHRPVSTPEGMVYSSGAGIWVDIYLASGTGASTLSVNGGTIRDNRNWMDFVDDGAAVKKRLLWDHEFSVIAAGSNEETNILGSSDPGTTGGHEDTANRRMISNIGVEDACGAMWQWLLDTSYRYDGGAHAHTTTITHKASATGSAVSKDQAETNFNAVLGSGADETVNTSSVDPAPSWGFYDLPGSKGSIYRQGTYGDVKLLAGAGWHYGANCGSRARTAINYRWYTNTLNGGRFCAEQR